MTSILVQAGIDTGRLDVLAIFAHVLDVDKSLVIADITKPTPRQAQKIQKLVDERAKRAPLAYLLHHKEFYGREYYVDKHVLIPRPESEAMIELALKLQLPDSYPVADIGCGSGVLGITYALEANPDSNSRHWLTLCDISPEALIVAKLNARRHKIRAQYAVSNLLESKYAASRCDGLVFANLPYVPDNLITSAEITKEPAIALFSGRDGLDHYRRFWEQITELDQKPKYIIIECLEKQFSELDALAAKAGFALVSTLGLARCFCRHS